MQEKISLHFFGLRLDNRFQQITSIDEKCHKMINWDVRDLAFRKMSDMDKLSLFRLLHKKWPTNMKIASWDTEQSPFCSRYIDREETSLHIFQCTSGNTHEQHNKI